MSKKHNQRTRAEILAKRQQPIPESRLNRDRFGAPARTSYKPQRSIYVPLIGAKEQARAKRCYMSPTFNCSGNLRACPVMHQISKSTREEQDQLWQQEYDSVF